MDIIVAKMDRHVETREPNLFYEPDSDICGSYRSGIMVVHEKSSMHGLGKWREADSFIGWLGTLGGG